MIYGFLTKNNLTKTRFLSKNISHLPNLKELKEEIQQLKLEKENLLKEKEKILKNTKKTKKKLKSIKRTPIIRRKIPMGK